MIKRNILMMLTMALVLLLASSCSSEHEFDMAGDAPEALKPGMIRFVLDKSLSQQSATAGAQTPEEQRINSIYAVVFNDISKDAMTGTPDTEVEGDTFLKCIKVSAVAGQSTGQLYEFEIGKEEGFFQVCFVANPSQDLLDKINASLSSGTVAGFKALVEEQAPELAKGLLMTSSFYGVKVTPLKEESLSKVDLTRAVARIDIENGADGVEVTKIEFINRAVKTPLVNSANTTDKVNLASVSEDVAIAGGKWVGNSANPTVVTAYSYEQLNTAADLPSLRITYNYLGEQSTAASHVKEIRFERAQTFNPIALERNHRYTVKLTHDGGDLNFIVTVADWVADNNLPVGSDDVLDGLFPELGDIMLSDGTIVEAAKITQEQKGQAIGVVAFLFKDNNMDRAGASLQAKLGRKPKGLVLALKNATDKNGDTFDWCLDEGNEFSGHPSLGDAYLNCKDGYSITATILGEKPKNRYPAFDAVNNYATTANAIAPPLTTGWYMPSLGEWVDILGNKGLGGINLSEVENARFDTTVHISNHMDPSTYPSILLQALDAAMAKAGSYDKLYLNKQDHYWSSSETNANYDDVYSLCFGSQSMYFSHGGKVLANGKVRCILAF